MHNIATGIAVIMETFSPWLNYVLKHALSKMIHFSHAYTVSRETQIQATPVISTIKLYIVINTLHLCPPLDWAREPNFWMVHLVVTNNTVYKHAAVHPSLFSNTPVYIYATNITYYFLCTFWLNDRFLILLHTPCSHLFLSVIIIISLEITCLFINFLRSHIMRNDNSKRIVLSKTCVENKLWLLVRARNGNNSIFCHAYCYYISM